MAKKGSRRLISWVLNSLSIVSAIALILSYLAPYVHPESIGIIPVFGLAYPLIVVVFISLMLIQLFFRKWWALSMFVLLIIGTGLHFRILALGDGDDLPKGSSSLKIMSYNVRLFGRYSETLELADETRLNILKFLKRESPDVVCFQEFYHQDKPTSFQTKDTIIPLLGIKDYQERYAHRISGRQNFGIALFSRYPIIEKGEVRFGPEASISNFAIYSDIVFEKDTIRIYNVHLQSIRLEPDDKAALSSEESETGFFAAMEKVMSAFPERAEQSNRLMRHIANSKHPVVVCGDFNDTPISYTYQRFHNELTDAFRNCRRGIGKTYAGKIPAGRIDYIFHSESLGSHDFTIQEDALSDHYAIACKVFVKSK